MKTVKSCARCGNDHELEERWLTRPMSPPEVFWAWESWAPCPVTQEPVLLSTSWAFLTGEGALMCPHPYYAQQQWDLGGLE
jgi:hypothetical protein